MLRDRMLPKPFFCFSLLPPILQPSDAVLVRMGDSRQAVDALDHVRQQNFVLLLHMGDQFHGLCQSLVAFSQLFETLIDVHLSNSIAKVGFFSENQIVNRPMCLRMYL